MDYLIFLVCAAAIVLAGPRMVRTVESVAQITGLGRVWLGGILLAGATSLPELAAVTTAGAIDEPDLAVGTVLGSNLFNMAVLGGVFLVLPLAVPRARARLTGLLPLALGLAVLLFLVAGDWEIGRIGISAPLIGLLYGLGAFALYRLARDARDGASDPRVADGGGQAAAVPTYRPLIGAMLLTTAVVFAASIFLAPSAEAIAEDLGVAKGVVGVALLAVATSLPEIVTSISALSRGAPEFLLGNLWGSNAVNLALVLPADLSFGGGSLLATASTDHIAAAAFGIAVMLIALLAAGSEALPGRRRLLGGAILAGYVAALAVTVSLGVDAG